MRFKKKEKIDIKIKLHPTVNDEFNKLHNDIKTNMNNITNKLDYDPTTTQGTLLQVQQQYKDDKRGFKGTVTNFNINNLLGSPQSKSRFLNLIFTVIDTSLKIYKKVNKLDKNDIIFYYKGGNILRIIANHISKYTDDYFELYFRKYFKKSDDDFSIFINDHRNFNTILNDVNNIIHQCLYLIRKEINLKKTYYFDYFNLSNQEKQNKLQELLDDLNKLDDVDDINNTFFGVNFQCLQFDDLYNAKCNTNTLNKYNNRPVNSHKEDFVVFHPVVNQVVDKNQIKTLIEDKTKRLFYNYYNSTLTFDRLHQAKASFDLFRTKANFICYFRKLDDEMVYTSENIGGELIDISVPLLIDTSRQRLAKKYKNDKSIIKKYFRKYAIKRQSIIDIFSKPVIVRGVTIEYLIHDLERMLLIDIDKPWDDIKYEKRIGRLFFLYLFETVKNITKGTIQNYFEPFMYLKSFIEVIPKTGFINQNNTDEAKKLYDTISLMNPVYMPLIDNMLTISNMIYKNNKSNNVSITNQDQDYLKKLNGYLTFLNRYTDILINYIKILDKKKQLKIPELVKLDPLLFGGQLL
jgi:hypothetical protein